MYMYDARAERILQKLDKTDSPDRIRFLVDSISQSKVKMSKKVYNLSTRNIKQFIKEHRQMELKRRQEVVNLKQQNNTKKRYDENQLLELEFRIVQTEYDPVYIEKCKTESDITSIIDRKTQKKLLNKVTSGFNAVDVTENNKTAMNRPKRVTYIQPNPFGHLRHESSEILPRIFGIRKKSKSTFEDINKIIPRQFDLSSKLRCSQQQKSSESIKKSPSSILPNNSIKSLGKKNLSTIIQNLQSSKLIEITEDKITRYIKSLHILVNGCYDFGSSLNEQTVNKLLLQRYSVPKLKKQQEKDLSTIQIEAKTFSLPYAEFISESQIRKSIHRIINMSVKMAQRVVFQLLDLNRNGYIDEKDMIDLAELSFKIPQIKQDFIKIVRYMRKQENFNISNTESISYLEDSFRQIQKINGISPKYNLIQSQNISQKNLKPPPIKLINKLLQKNQRSHTYSTSELAEEVTSSKQTLKNSKTINTTNFNKKKFYSFIESRKNFFNSKKIKEKEKFKFSLCFQDFQKIFADERPLVFYDLIKYLLGVRKQDLIDRQMGQQSDRLRKQNESKVKIRHKDSYEHKNYNVPEIIKDFQKRFTCDIEMSKYQQVLNLGKILQRPQEKSVKEPKKQQST